MYGVTGLGGRALASLLTLGAAAALLSCHEERPNTGAPSAHAAAPRASVDGGRPAVKDAVAGAPAPSPAAAQAPSDPGSVAPGSPSLMAARTPAQSVPSASLRVAVAANNAFATALFAQLGAQGARENLLTAPISAHLALSMAYAGARGRTRTEMGAALQFGGREPEALIEGQNGLRQALLARGAEGFAASSQGFIGSQSAPAASDYVLQVVNSVWGEASYDWAAPFMGGLAANYGAPVVRRDFRQQAEPARLEINGWVSEQTGGKIRDLLPPGALSGATRLVLVNALHLKFPWDVPFAPSATAGAPFTLADHRKIQADFMRREAQLAYLDDGQAQVVALPLAGRRLSLIVALPHASVSLADYERTLRAGSAALTPPSKSALVALALPKATFTSPSFSLTAPLRKLGMHQAFERERADFGAMGTTPVGEPPLFVSDVLQKTMIAMQESGVEAAAATAVVMSTAAALLRRPAPIAMTVNRPYLIALVDVPTGAVLLLGHIADPTATGE